MKRVLSVFSVLVIAIFVHGCGEGTKSGGQSGQQTSSGQTQQNTTQTQQNTTQTQQNTAQTQTQVQLEKKKEELNNTEWQMELTLVTGKKKTVSDVLTFFNKKTFSSKVFSEKGYPSSNYMLRLESDDVAIWETMQTSPEQGVAFWRGTLQGGVMTGTVRTKPEKGDKEVYTFKSTGSRKVEPPAPGTEKPAEDTATTPAGTPKKTAPAGEGDEAKKKSPRPR